MRLVNQGPDGTTGVTMDSGEPAIMKLLGGRASVPRILILERERIVAHDLRVRLCRLGYVVTAVVSSEAEARATVNSDQVDVMLMDIEDCGDCESDAPTSGVQAWPIPVVCLTDRLIREPKCECIAKPYGPDELEKMLAWAVARRSFRGDCLMSRVAASPNCDHPPRLHDDIETAPHLIRSA